MPITPEQVAAGRELQRRGRLTSEQTAALDKMERRSERPLSEALVGAEIKAPRPRNIADIVGEYAAPVGATVGGIVGSIPLTAPLVGGPVGGAMLGAAAFGGAGQALQARYGERRPSSLGPLPLERGFEAPAAPPAPGLIPPTGEAGRALAGMAVETGKQAAYEAVPRALVAGAGAAYRTARGTQPIVGTPIRGVQIPETAGGYYGREGGYLRTMESYLSGTILGRPLREAGKKSRMAHNQILADLSGAPGATPLKPAQSWQRAAKLNEGAAQGLYQQLDSISVPNAPSIAQEILDEAAQQQARLSSASKTALNRLASQGGEDAKWALAAKHLGYGSADEARRKVGEKGLQQFLAGNPALAAEIEEAAAGPTLGNVIRARTALNELAVSSSDANTQRIARESIARLDKFATGAALSVEQRAMYRRANTLWRRTHLMDDLAQLLWIPESKTRPSGVAHADPLAFVKYVRELAEPVISKTKAGQPIARRSRAFHTLFPQARDRQALIQLADHLGEPGKVAGRATGITDALAKIGVALAATGGVSATAAGQPGLALKIAGYLEFHYFLAVLLSRPGGATLLRNYFKQPAASLGPAATRLVGFAFDESKEEVPTALVPAKYPVLQPPPASAHPSLQGLFQRRPTQ